jgi:hypothetical protein
MTIVYVLVVLFVVQDEKLNMNQRAIIGFIYFALFAVTVVSSRENDEIDYNQDDVY